MDSDVLVWQNLSEWELLDKIDVALEIPWRQNIAVIPEDNDYRWVAGAGVSYFKREALTDFVDFCIEMYANHKDILRQKWDIHKKYSIGGGVCEMSLLYLWVKNRREMKVLNLFEKIEGKLPCVILNESVWL